VYVSATTRYQWWHNVFLVGLNAVPPAADIEHIRAEIECHAASDPERIVVLVHNDFRGVLDEAARRAIVALMRVLDATAAYDALVVDVSGFLAARLRAVQAGIELLSGCAFRMHHCSSIDQALDRAQPWIAAHESMYDLRVALREVSEGPPGAARARVVAWVFVFGTTSRGHVTATTASGRRDLNIRGPIDRRLTAGQSAGRSAAVA
jgi:hypothetical protein